MVTQSNLGAVIENLPDRLRADYLKNKDGFGGNTAQMNEAGYNMVTNLQHMWADVVSAGVPAEAFGMAPAEWIADYVKRLSKLYGVLNEPDGPGTGGTIVGQLVAGDLMNDLQRLVARTVQGLTSTQDNIGQYGPWIKRWDTASASLEG